MPRLRNPRTGVVVDVDEETAERLRSTHEPTKTPTAAAVSRRPKK